MNDIIPIIVGVLAAVGVYIWLYREEQLRISKNPKVKPEEVNYIIPAVIGVIIWFITGALMPCPPPTPIQATAPVVGPIFAPSGDIISVPQKLDYVKKSYRLIGRGKMALPRPAAFIKLSEF